MQDSNDLAGKDKVVKINLSEDEQRFLRAVAGWKNVSMTEFAKQAVIDAVRTAAKGIDWSELGPKNDAAPAKRRKRQ